ncbi:MAG: Na(+)-translocating NADH-quinone reductase subunit A, partial [Planctomycetaceae bacterium]|nr:Na(+)-translocating NADH-quinone reductase subunit A [Planctomycetaceae bacterium]
MHRITKGLDIPITGQPDQSVVDGPEISRVALIGPDYVGMKPTMLVAEGDAVKLGQPVFEDKKTPGVMYTAPAAGRVVQLNRGDRRAFQSLVIEVEGDQSVTFPALAERDFAGVSREAVTDVLVSSGLWTAFRTRPFSKVPQPGTVPRSIFVQAIDTNPLAPDPVGIIRARERDFRFGLQAVARLTDGNVFLCRRPATPLPGEDVSQVQVGEFEGPHPAGLPGTHIHFLDPVGPGRTVWTVNYQDVLAIGYLVSTGMLCTERVVSVAGPAVANPQVVRTRLGANISGLVAGRLSDHGNTRIISGSVLNGRAVSGPFDYLGRYHLQVSALAEGNHREFLGWLTPGSGRFSVRNIFASALDRSRRFAFDTSTGGSKRAMVPIGMYEQVVPLDVVATFLLRSLIVGDTEQAQALGCLELDEEDLSLCTFVCPGKYEYGTILRRNLS